MKESLFRELLIFFVILILRSLPSLAQDNNKQQGLSILSGVDFTWSVANYGDGNNPGDQIIRFSPVNLQSIAVYHRGHIGYFGGISLRNNGFIMPGQGDIDQIKFRTYNIGFPVGLKVGNGELLAFYAGYELEFPLHYKERTYSSLQELRDKNSEWFSEKVPDLNHSAFIGFQVFKGINIKMKYYFSNFFNQTYEDQVGNQPLLTQDVNLFHLSFNFFFLESHRFIYGRKKESVE